MKLTIDTLDNLWLYPFGIIIEYKNKQYIYIGKHYELGKYFLYNGRLIWEDEIFEDGIDDENIKIKIYIPDSENIIKNYIDGVVTDTIMLLDEYGLHKDNIDRNVKTLEILTKIYNLLKGNK